METKEERKDVFSKVVRAGRRTYFFDVKATRKNDYYLTLTESKQTHHEDGNVGYEKHRIFLYKEDFDKFAEGLTDAISFVKAENEKEGLTSYNSEEDNKEDKSNFDFETL